MTNRTDKPTHVIEARANPERQRPNAKKYLKSKTFNFDAILPSEAVQSSRPAVIWDFFGIWSLAFGILPCRRPDVCSGSGN
jgi:hypothetical protein